MVRSVAYLFHLTVSLCTSVCISFVLMLYLYGSMCAYLCVCVDYVFGTCEGCNSFHFGCSFYRAVIKHCSQFVVDFSPSGSN